MRYIKFNGGLICQVSNEYPKEGPWGKENGWQSTRDAESFEEASTWARYLTAMTGNLWLPADATASTSPRYSVFEAPKVGDLVSYGFNGDCYPCGEIEKITKGWRITTSTGKKFSRYKQTAGWRAVGGTWSMVAGHVEERNPHF
jgi:hypothetical protein